MDEPRMTDAEVEEYASGVFDFSLLHRECVIARASEQRDKQKADEAIRLLGEFFDARYGDNSDCEEPDCEWCILRRNTWPLVKDLTGTMNARVCPHEAKAERFRKALEEIVVASASISFTFPLRQIAAAALAPERNDTGAEAPRKETT